MAVIAIFFFASFVFFLYDRLVQWRQKKVNDSAIRANAIVFSLFPAKVAEQLQRDAVEEEKLNDARREAAANGRGIRGRRGRLTADRMMQDDTQDGDDDDTEVLLDSKPIADLFPSATVLFADIAGFTAWSSIREPSQVFLLLESIYRAFDKIAVHRGIFKVETIGMFRVRGSTRVVCATCLAHLV
jgi:Adenylate and Guanylate cyclase catalytic domain